MSDLEQRLGISNRLRAEALEAWRAWARVELGMDAEGAPLLMDLVLAHSSSARVVPPGFEIVDNEVRWVGSKRKVALQAERWDHMYEPDQENLPLEEPQLVILNREYEYLQLEYIDLTTEDSEPVGLVQEGLWHLEGFQYPFSTLVIYAVDQDPRKKP